VSDHPTIFTKLTRSDEIGANCYLLELDGVRIILDAGMHPKEDGKAATPRYEDLAHDSVDAIVVSHSHLDHVGTLPVVMEDQPTARVFLTPATYALADALLHNSVNVMQSQRMELGITEYPFFTHRGIEEAQKRWEARDYEKTFEVDFEGRVRMTFYDAGHILGSAGVLIEGGGKRIFYTGDVHFDDHALICGAAFPKLEDLDVLILETTRGDFERPADYTRLKEEERFIGAIRESLSRGGSALIPVFAIGKTQEVLTMIHECKEDGRLPDVPVYIGGLSTKMTVIYDKFAKTTRRTLPDFEILRDLSPVTGSKKKRLEITYQPGCIYALSSGMMTEKTVSNGFARQFINKPKNTLLFVGYTDPSTPGARVKNAERGKSVSLDAAQDPVLLDCDVETFDFSGHAPREQLLNFAHETKAKQTLLVHGDPPALNWFLERVENSSIPPSGKQIFL
jgi:Cft2 family RNA processing exonuclease